MAPGQEDGEEEDGQPAVTPEQWRRYQTRVRELVKARALTEAAGDAKRAVYAQLAKTFTPGAIAWVRSAEWSGPKRVPIDQIDTSSRTEWDASRDEDSPKVAKFRRKLRKKRATGGQPKPVVLVQVPGSKQFIIADGHHHYLAAEQEDLSYVWAYVGKVDAKHGDWDVLAASRAKHVQRDRAA